MIVPLVRLVATLSDSLSLGEEDDGSGDKLVREFDTPEMEQFLNENQTAEEL